VNAYTHVPMNVDGLVNHWQSAIETAVERTCSRWRVTGADAEDLKAELWLCVLRDHNRVLRRFEGRSAIETYLFVVLKRAALKWITRQRTRRAMEAAADPLRLLCVPGAPPAEYLMSVRTAMSKLQGPDRELLQMWAEGYSFGEIASRRGESAKAVEHRVYRAIASVRVAMGIFSRPGH
jgi:RNA polymerase sigma factor (sigma-70 family)